MKKNIFLITLLTSFPVYADVFMLPETADILYESAYPLNEYLISTADKKCVFHYLSKNAPQETDKIVIKNISYPDECLKKGFATIQIVNSQNTPIKTFKGFFIDGFFTGNLPLNTPVVKRTSDELKNQYLNFLIDEDKELNIRYIGTMHSYLGNETYTAFNACNPFNITLQTSNKSLFQDAATVKNLITVVKSYAKTLCPTEKIINIDASDSPSLNKDGVFFKQQLIFNETNGEWVLNTLQAPTENKVVLQKKQAIFKQNPFQLLTKSQQTNEAETGTFIVHISDKTTKKVVYADLPFIMKAHQNEHEIKQGWYEITGSIKSMDDFERKKSGISLNKPAAILEIKTFKPCETALCTD